MTSFFPVFYKFITRSATLSGPTNNSLSFTHCSTSYEEEELIRQKEDARVCCLGANQGKFQDCKLPDMWYIGRDRWCTCQESGVVCGDQQGRRMFGIRRFSEAVRNRYTSRLAGHFSSEREHCKSCTGLVSFALSFAIGFRELVDQAADDCACAASFQSWMC